MLYRPIQAAVSGEQRRRRRALALLLFAAIALAGVVALIIASQQRQPDNPSHANTPSRDLSAAVAGVPDIALSAQVMPLSREEAEQINALRQPDVIEVTAAKGFTVDEQWRADPRFGTAVDCLTQAVYYEAASEPDAGQRAVAQVVLNRVRHPAFPNSVCGVVYQGSHLPTGCQFTFTCDGSLARQPSRGGWARARRVALAALSGWVEAPVGLATNYHADYVVPYWASSLRKVRTVGRHIFYTIGGRGGSIGAFSARYDLAGELPPMIKTLQDQPLDLTGDDAVTLPGTITPSPLLADELTRRSAPHADTAAALREEQSRLRADQEAGELQVRGGDSRLIVD